jgi:hypothetical protein
MLWVKWSFIVATPSFIPNPNILQEYPTEI